MKRSLVTLMVACAAMLPLSSFAQALFPLADIEKFCTKNLSDFETEVLMKDYSLQGKLSNATTKVYASDKANANGKPNMITRSQVPNAKPNIVVATTDKKYYLELKAKLPASGYKFVKEENKAINGEQVSVYNFSNTKYQVSLYSTTKEDIVWYTVQIHL